MKLLEKHFEIALETPDGITRLRELILNLAMQGKLVKQDFINESAYNLIEKIEFERKILIEKKTIRINKQIQNTIKSDIKIPKNWTAVNLEFLASFINGDRGKNYPSKKNYVLDGIPFINAGHLKNGIVSLDEMNYISENSYDKLGSGKIKEGDLIYCLRGSLGKSAIVKCIYKGAIASSLVIIRPFLNELTAYIYFFLVSPFGKRMISKYDNGTAQPNLSSSNLQKYIIPLPPIEEQKRIVEKIEQLMLLCDKLEAEKKQKNKLQLQINSASINNLIKAHDEISFNNAWSFVANQFNTLYTEKQNVTDLKNVILELAIRGKLIKQDRNQSAKAEYKFIEYEKNNIEGHKINSALKKNISDNEIPFIIPENWTWVRLGNICSKIGSGSTPRGGKNVYKSEGIKFIRSQNVYNFGLVFDNVVFIDSDTHKKMSNTKVISNDILLNITGGSIGRCALVPKNFDEANVSQHVTILRLLNDIDHQFIHQFILSPYFQKKIMQVQTGANREGLAKKNMELMLIPLPPYNEQKVISNRVEELFKFCNKFEELIDQSSKKQTQILNAVLAHL